MTTDNNYRPRSEADRHQASYEGVPGSQRRDGNYTMTQQRVSLTGGALAEAQLSTEEETLLYLKAIAIGLSMMTDTDLIDQALRT